MTNIFYPKWFGHSMPWITVWCSLPCEQAFGSLLSEVTLFNLFAQVCWFIVMKKSSTLREGVCIAFSKHKEEHNRCSYINIWLKDGNLVGFAAVLPSQSLNEGLPGAASIFTAEMWAIKTAIEKLVKTTVNQAVTQFSQTPKCTIGLQVNCSWCSYGNGNITAFMLCCIYKDTFRCCRKGKCRCLGKKCHNQCW